MSQNRSLQADCGSCFGLCCVVSGFAASSDFAITKSAGTPCPNLQHDFRCGIHAQLRDRGFAGCTVYDCFGAGQQVSQVTFDGQEWRAAPGSRASMFAVFPVMRSLHELLWYLREAQLIDDLPDLTTAEAEVERCTLQTPDQLLALDVAGLRARIAGLLRTVSARARAGDRPPPGHVGADLIGADLIGADLRGADLSGADLIGVLFLTQAQLNAAAGDGQTRLPARRDRPAHWNAGQRRPGPAPARLLR